MATRKFYSINYIIVDLPAPQNLSFAWRFGSLLGLLLSIQIITGFILSMYYSSSISTAFERVLHIQREVTGGWALRTLHSNGASLFFLFLYFHMGRGLYYKSYQGTATWSLGVTIFIISIAIAFIGYLLPWGQIRYWGATVITNLFSAIPYVGSRVVQWIWGGYAVGRPTLRRFFAAHFLLPFILVLLVLLHLRSLHNTGSSNPLGTRSRYKVLFHPYYPRKDIVGFLIIALLLFGLVFYAPFFLGDPDNWIPANNIVTPRHIKPEWYFLWVYAILRSIPNKVGGVLAIVIALGRLLLLPYARVKHWFNCRWLFLTVILLTWIGGSPVEAPYTFLGGLFTILYFILLYIIIIYFRVRLYESHWCCDYGDIPDD